MPDSKLTFDADTASYDAKMAASLKGTQSLTGAFTEMAGPALKMLSIVGLLEAGVSAVGSRFQTWRDQLEKAAAANNIIQQDLASALGSAGRMGDYKTISNLVTKTEGPLSLKGKETAVGSFLGASPDASNESIAEFLKQAELATAVVGEKNVDKYSASLSQGMAVGLSQKYAGNVALAAAQAGPSGAEGLTRMFGKFSEEHPGGGDAEFREFAASSTAQDLGVKATGIVGFNALKSRIAKGSDLTTEAGIAYRTPEVAGEIEKAARNAGTESLSKSRYGSRADLQEDYESLRQRIMAAGGSDPGKVDAWKNVTTSDAALSEVNRKLGVREAQLRGFSAPGVSRSGAADAFARQAAVNEVGEGLAGTPRFMEVQERALKALEGIHAHSVNVGAAKFRNENQDRDKEPE